MKSKIDREKVIKILEDDSSNERIFIQTAKKECLSSYKYFSTKSLIRLVGASFEYNTYSNVLYSLHNLPKE